ncbi:hypothetical protein [Streptomyces sp. NRRL S-87]|uniref:hypothetical protein n=1 Tax=Streptomyces sp. NRRL S-87 TaxID=1463920 RepID=UPI0004C0B1F8|nr:hypothetical protein [Streptomyces sp. NRRL S-87]
MADVVPAEAPDLQLARVIVARLAPQELPLFELTARSLVGDGGRRVGRGSGGRGRVKDDPLAFGGVAEVVVTGVACGVAVEVVKAMSQDLGAGLVVRLRRRLARRRAGRAGGRGEGAREGLALRAVGAEGAVERTSAGEGAAVPAAGGERVPGGAVAGSGVLSEERIAELRDVARRSAVLLGLPEDRSELLAAVVAEHLRGAGRAEA